MKSRKEDEVGGGGGGHGNLDVRLCVVMFCGYGYVCSCVVGYGYVWSLGTEKESWGERVEKLETGVDKGVLVLEIYIPVGDRTKTLTSKICALETEA